MPSFIVIFLRSLLAFSFATTWVTISSKNKVFYLISAISLLLCNSMTVLPSSTSHYPIEIMNLIPAKNFTKLKFRISALRKNPPNGCPTTVCLTKSSKKKKRKAPSCNTILNPLCLKLTFTVDLTTRNHGGSLSKRVFLRTKQKWAKRNNPNQQFLTNLWKIKQKISPKTMEKLSFLSSKNTKKWFCQCATVSMYLLKTFLTTCWSSKRR